MKTYAVKEIFATLQGEGAHAGRAAVFCRFTGCNLWNGLESGRENAQCDFCDTDFVGTDGPGGGRFSAEELVGAIATTWPAEDSDCPVFVVLTGGEPLLQLDAELLGAMKGAGFEIAIETNGTLPLPGKLDWVCVSPKGHTELVLTEGDELKLVYPQLGVDPGRFAGLNFRHFSLQPLDNPKQADNTRRAIAYCQKHPRWRLSVQTHKNLGIP